MQYTPEDVVRLSNGVLDAMSDLNMSTRKACTLHGLPLRTFLNWVDASPSLQVQYASARALLLEHMAEDFLDITDGDVPTLMNGGMDSAAVADKRLRADSRKWLLSKLAPKKYGDKLEMTGRDGGPMDHNVSLTVVGVRGK